MQSKALAAEVDETFVKETLLKHRETVTKITSTPEATLCAFETFITPWIQTVADSQLKGEFPNSHSCYESSRSKGGVRSNFSVVNTEFIQPTQPRLEPTTLLISGRAGCGKSLLQTLLTKSIAKRLGHMDLSQTSFSRNSSVEHWDGYKHQPLVLVDDFLQKIVKQAEDVVEHTEFIAMNSSVDYVLPMAELKRKGTIFDSPLLVYSSNKTLEACVRSLKFTQTDTEALERRFTFYLENFQNRWVLSRVRLLDQGIKNQRHNLSKVVFSCDNVFDMVEPLTDQLLAEWNRKGVYYNNNISSDESIPIGLKQSMKCMIGDDHNKVKVTPILEPLKVRTITIGTARNFLLKSLQKEMLSALRPYPAFLPCFTPSYDEKIKTLHSLEGKTWLSGDYSSATDGLHSDLFYRGVQKLCEALKLSGQPGWLIDLALREASPHICEYPMDIPECLQTNGQLMGSLLSFPFLCLANAFTVAQAEGHNSLRRLDACLIHGDDLLWRTETSAISRWKDFCPTIGLGLSMGKNYVDERWGSIDSQVFFEGVRKNTGKYSSYIGDDAQKVETLLRKGLSKSYVVKLSKAFLKKTPRSIDVSTEFGGLGCSGLPISNRSKLLNNLKQRKKVGSIAKLPNGYAVTLPKLFLPKSFDKNIDLETREANDTVLWSTLHKLEKSKTSEFYDLELQEQRTVFISERNRSLELLLENLKEHYCSLKSKE
jgi:hypothetical protein